MLRSGAVRTDRSDVEREALERRVGSVVSEKYRIDRLLGQGGMGAVYQATNLAIGKRVALKFLTPDAARDRDATERFQREALAASVVESAHIVQIFDSGTDEGLPFLVMELLSGEDLRARLKREATLSIEETANIAAQILRALVRAHAGGIVHRDLKPENVFLCKRDDDSLFVKIVDFGISKLGRATSLDTLTRRGTVLGTAYYMSPEQAQAYADVDGRTDLFSVGAILFECLAGRPPHAAPTYEAVLIAICTKDAEDVRELAPRVPAPFAAVIRRALARERSERFQSAAEMLDALIASIPTAFVAPFGSTPSGSMHGALEQLSADGAGAFASTARAPNASRKRRAGTWVSATLALLAGFVLTAYWMRSTPGPPLPLSADGDSPSAPIPRILAPKSLEAPPVPLLGATPSSSSAALAAPSGALEAKRPRAPVRLELRTTRPKPPERVGVAKDLELSTKEP